MKESDMNLPTIDLPCNAWNMPMCSGQGQMDSRVHGTTPYDTITGAQIVDMVVNPPAMDKASARWVIPSTLHSTTARNFSEQENNGVFWMIPFDFDVDPPSLDRARDAILAIFPGAYLVQYTSSSATMDKQKSRAFVYLAHPIGGGDYQDTINATYDLLDEGYGIIADRALNRSGQLIYLPNRGAFYQHQTTNGWAVVLSDDHPVIVRREADRVIRVKEKAIVDAAQAVKRAELDARRTKGEVLPIDEWNATNDINDVLRRYGYKQGRRGNWCPPSSTSNSYSLSITTDNRWFYFGSSMAGIGMAGKGCQHGDAFDLFVHHTHNGDRAAALRSLDTPEAAHTRALTSAFAAGMPEEPVYPPGVVPPPEGGVPAQVGDPTPAQRMEMAAQIEGMDVMDKASLKLAATYKVTGDPRFEMMEERARDSRSLTEFTKKVGRIIKKRAHDALVARELQKDHPRKFFDVSEPNDYIYVAEDIECIAGERDMAFVFGGNAVVMKTMESVFGRIAKRDSNGNKVLGVDGEVETEPAHSTQAKVIKSPDLRRLASKIGFFQVRDSEGIKQSCDTPGSLIQQMEAAMGETLKPMQGIVQHPVIWRGELLFGNNVFHKDSGLFLQTGNLNVDHWDDPKEAYRWLVDEWLGDFSFATDLDRAKAIMMPASMLLAKTDLMHQSGPPIFLDTAPFPGTGKSLKTSVCHAAVTGSPAPTSIYPEQKEERGKIITATIMEGQTHLAFDNLKSGSTIGNSHHELATLVTSPMFKGRILGVSKEFTGPAGVVITLNGNNIIVAGDMISRTIEVRHEPNLSQNLAQRTFRHPDLMAWTLENRHRIIGALACVLRHRMTEEPDGRFPEWAKLVAEPIIAASGVTGFYEQWIEAGDVDVIGAAPDSLLTLANYLTPMMAGQWHTSEEIAVLINTSSHIRSSVFHTDQAVSAKMVSGYLRRNRGANANGVRLHGQQVNLGERTGRHKRWCFALS
jgi:hypothetical protein